jgi:hypothetical protein
MAAAVARTSPDARAAFHHFHDLLLIFKRWHWAFKGGGCKWRGCGKRKIARAIGNFFSSRMIPRLACLSVGGGVAVRPSHLTPLFSVSSD